MTRRPRRPDAAVLVLAVWRPPSPPYVREPHRLVVQADGELRVEWLVGTSIFVAETGEGTEGWLPCTDPERHVEGMP